MNFLQFAVWGSYLTSMGSYLADAGMASHIGMFYAMQGIVSIFMPAVIGIIADRWVQAQRLLGICHALAALFMGGGLVLRLQCGRRRYVRAPFRALLAQRGFLYAYRGALLLGGLLGFGAKRPRPRESVSARSRVGHGRIHLLDAAVRLLGIPDEQRAVPAMRRSGLGARRLRHDAARVPRRRFGEQKGYDRRFGIEGLHALQG